MDGISEEGTTGKHDKPLKELVIIDLSRVLAGPFCTMILADHGARVIKIEMPEKGDDSRGYEPFVNGKSSYFSSINRGKESIAINLCKADDRQLFEKLLEKADVLTENFRPGTMKKHGYGWRDLQKKYPRLIYASVSGFGQQDSQYVGRPAYDMVIQAMSGIMSETGGADRSPTRVGMSIADISAGIYLCQGILMALYSREKSGLGCQVDIAMLDCLISMLEFPIMRHLATDGSRSPKVGYRTAIAPPFGVFNTGCGSIVIAAGNDKLFSLLCEALAVPELSLDKRFADSESRKDNENSLYSELEKLLSNKSADEWNEIIVEHGVPCSLINRVDEMLADPHVKARSMLVAVEGGSGPRKVVGTPLKFSNVDAFSTVQAAPDLDQDREKILKDFDISNPEQSV